MSENIDRKPNSSESVASGKELQRFNDAVEELTVQSYKKRVIHGDEVNVDELRVAVTKSLRDLITGHGLGPLFGIKD